MDYSFWPLLKIAAFVMEKSRKRVFMRLAPPPQAKGRMVWENFTSCENCACTTLPPCGIIRAIPAIVKGAVSVKQTAFVTGGSRGIGRAIVRRLAARGYAVGIDYLQSEEQANALAAELRGQGCAAFAVRGDVSDRTSITAAIRRAEDALGPVSLLVNNAGIAAQTQFQDITDAFWQKIFATNVNGAFYATQAVLPRMLHEKAGAIVNISSIWGQRGASCEVAYSATKAALIGLTRSLAMELAPSGIRVNCVAPGVIRTDMVEVLGEETLGALAEDTPLGRLGTPEDIAAAVAFLADGDAGFITGQVLTADGGFIL